jgi:O-succinylbenzoic acid--CoA ligase
MMCPLREAARETPNHIAILSKSTCMTFRELDRYVDRVKVLGGVVQAEPTIEVIAQFFACWRQDKCIFPVNPRGVAGGVNGGPAKSVLLYTSGSTSSPKIAVLSLDSLLANAKGCVEAVDLRIGDQWRLSLPLYHVGGIGIVLRCVLARAAIVLDDSMDITHLSYIPTHLYRTTPVYKKLRCLLLGGSPVLSVPKGLPIRLSYGLTEMGSMVSLDGEVLKGREVKIAEDGEILVRGSCLFNGYLGEEPVRGWFATGDLGKFDKGLVILGRKDWMFISGGENIQPEEIEKELLQLDQVMDAAVVAKKDAEFGQRPVAFVQAKGLNLRQMQKALAGRLPKYKIPVALYLVEEIPKKNNFKIDRFILTQLANNEPDKNTSGQKK